MSHKKDMYYEIEILKAKVEEMGKRLDFVQSMMMKQQAAPHGHNDEYEYRHDTLSETSTEPSIEDAPTPSQRKSNTQMQRRAPV